MATRRASHADWIQQTRTQWAALAQGAIWVLGIVGGFLLPPPAGVSAGDENVWLRLAQFVVAVVVGLVFFAAHKWKSKRHAKTWWALSLLTLLMAVAAFFRYQHLLYAWTGDYYGERKVVGAEHTPHGLVYAEQNPNLSREELLKHFAGAAHDIWTRESIDLRRLILAGTYLLCLPLFTVCLISIVQAIQCLSPKKAKPGG